MSEPKLPEDYRFGLVTARAIRAVGDMGPEGDPYPDGPPVKLAKAVTFTPADRWRLVPGDPSQRVIQEAIVADFDADGYLSLNGQRGLWLYHGLWHVRFTDELGWDGIDIQVTADHTQDHPLDLWTAAGFVPAPSVTVTTLLVPATVADGDVLIREGDHVTGVPQTRFTGPAGPRGARGEPGPPGQPSTFTGAGKGRPDMPDTLDAAGRSWVASAPVGAVWCSTDGAGVGAWQWQKLPSGWAVSMGDTGVVNVTSHPGFVSALTSPDGTLQLSSNALITARRISSLVILNTTLKHTKNVSSVTTAGMPLGWRPRIACSTPALTASSRAVCRLFLNAGGNRSSMTGEAVDNLEVHAVFDTDDPWPTGLK